MKSNSYSKIIHTDPEIILNLPWDLRQMSINLGQL